MRIISRKPLKAFWNDHPALETPLRDWWSTVSKAEWRNFADVRAMYGSADQVGPFVVFNIGGNKCRLIVRIDYQWGMVFVRHVLTHTEYDMGKWKMG